MSIMHEYEQIKKDIGNDEWNKIVKYVEGNDLLLSDVLYNEDNYKQYELWRLEH